MHSILLIGSQGQVGQELQSSLLPYGQVTEISRAEADLCDPESLRPIIRSYAPSIVINAAAYTAVDRAESEPELADRVNHWSPKVMAEECDRLGSSLIHISTDYVFDGHHHRPYREDDPTQPLSVYGSSKLAGEQAIQQVGCHHAIVRTAWVYGVGGKGNFVKTMLRLGKEREEIRVVADQIGTPTFAADLAQAISQLAPLIASKINPQPSGIYHYTNSGVASWYDFAVAIFEEARALDYPLTLQRVVPITTADYPTPAHRPPYSVLDYGKISASLGTYPPYWRQSMRLMLQELYAQTYERADSLWR